jgi:hypothetical protein
MTQTFGFRFDRPYHVGLALLGIRPSNSQVRLDDTGFEADFGRFHLETTWDNVVSAEVSGPYRAYRAIGPRLSLVDKGFTFGSSARGGVCVGFRDPVAVRPGPPRLRHPGLTVTVEDPDALAAAVLARIGSA